MDATLDYMLENNIPLTRENYLALEYLGQPPEEIGVEDEIQFPNEIRLPEFRDEDYVQKQDRKFLRAVGIKGGASTRRKR